MKIKKIVLKEFKRFDDLTIDLGDNPKKIVALVGPNGSGKSSVFDALIKLQTYHEPLGSNPNQRDFSYFSKTKDAAFQNKVMQNITIEFDQGTHQDVIATKRQLGTERTIFSFRSSFRVSSNLSVTELTAVEDIKKNQDGASSSSDVDQRIIENYKRFYSFLEKYRKQNDLTDKEALNQTVGTLNATLSTILNGLKVVDHGDIMARDGKFYFEKEGNTFDYNVLSAGEKECFDLLLDIFLRKDDYNDTIYIIDEPELHLNTSIQRSLIRALDSFISDTNQIVIATHSIGFLRGLQEELRDKVQILDFGERDYFQGSKTITPLIPSRENWQRIFSTALDDLTYLVAPKTIMYCEGIPAPGIGGVEIGLDATVYNHIFVEEFPDTLFISAGGGDVTRNAALALQIISKAFTGVSLYKVKDRDTKTLADRLVFLAESPSNRMLIRREIENYLFDKEVLRNYALSQGVDFDEGRYDSVVVNIQDQDLKLVQQSIQHAVFNSGSVDDFKKELRKHVAKGGVIYNELKNCIF